MRVNTRRTLEAWRKGKRLRFCDSIWTDGWSIYSYGTCLVTWLNSDDDAVIFNNTKYSMTTSIHQGALRGALTGKIWAVDNLPRGVSALRLKEEFDKHTDWRMPHQQLAKSTYLEAK